MKIFTKSYYNGLFLILSHGLAVKIAEKNGEIVFGKLTRSFDRRHQLSTQEAMEKFKVPLEYLQYFEINYHRFKIIWNVNYREHKIGDLYLPEHNKSINEAHNLVCDHIGYYRRYGQRANEGAWKLGVAGLNCEIFNKFKKENRRWK